MQLVLLVAPHCVTDVVRRRCEVFVDQLKGRSIQKMLRTTSIHGCYDLLRWCPQCRILSDNEPSQKCALLPKFPLILITNIHHYDHSQF